jgi:Cellulose binding domain
MSRSRRPRRHVLLWCWPAAAVAAVAAAFLARGGPGVTAVRTAAADSASPLSASYQAVTSWGSGYTGQYTITNGGTADVTGWTLAFRLPAGTTLSSLWNGSYTGNGGQVTVTNDGWDATVSAGGSVTVGFVTSSPGQAGAPGDCTINGLPCQGGAPGTATSPAATASPAASGSAPASPAPSPTAPATPSPSTAPSASAPAPAGPAGFAPYVDTSLYPPLRLVSTAQRTGVRQVNLAFVVAGGGGGCTPEWGGVTAIGSDQVAAQIGALRAIGGDVRISFGGEAGSELAVTCTSVSQLEAAYQQVISAYGVSKIDFDVEGAAVANSAANARRDQAIAALQAQDQGLQVSFTLPVLPSGLTSDGVAVLAGAAQAGVQISAVNVMAMDYGDGAAPSPSGRMGTYAIDAATAADAQVASVLGISDAAAWPKIAVTPMIGVNDTSDEVFTVADAQQLAAFAAARHLAWLSMWSAARDTECPGGAQAYASPTCSSIVQAPDAFMGALGAY